MLTVNDLLLGKDYLELVHDVGNCLNSVYCSINKEPAKWSLPVTLLQKKSLENWLDSQNFDLHHVGYNVNMRLRLWKKNCIDQLPTAVCKIYWYVISCKYINKSVA